MSEQGDDEAKYKVRWEADGKWTNSSRDRSGKASAEYFNGDKYEGEYVNGVKLFVDYLTSLSKDMAKATTPGRMVLSILVITLKTRNQDSVKPPTRSLESISVSFLRKFLKVPGFYEHGRRHGEGTFHYENGDSYSGWWKYGVKCGQGTYNYAKTGMRVSAIILISHLIAVWNLGK